MKTYIWRRALREFTSAPALYVLSTLIIAFCLTIFSFFALLYLNLEHFTNQLAQELVLNIYLEPGTTLADCGELVSELRERPEIADVRFLPAEKVLEDLKGLFENKDLASGVSPDFLPPLLEVAFKRPFQVLHELPSLAATISTYPHVLKVQYARSWLERLAGLKRFLELLSLTGLILLGGATVFIAGSTVKLSLSQRSRELEILSLVGATPGFVQGPLLVLAFFQALIALSFALLVLRGLHFYLGQALRGIFPGFSGGLLFFQAKELAILFGGVLTLCLSGCYWASRRFLRY